MSCLALAPSGHHLTVLDELAPPRVVRAFRIGERVPIRPPFGSGFVAWAEPEVRNRWLDQVEGGDLGRRSCEHALEVARRRGFAVELVTEPERASRELVVGLGDDLGAPGDANVSRMRELLEELASGPLDGEPFIASVVDPDTRYRVSTIGSPVFDSGQRVVLVLVVVSPGGSILGARVDAMGQRVADEAEALTRALGG